MATYSFLELSQTEERFVSKHVSLTANHLLSNCSHIRKGCFVSMAASLLWSGFFFFFFFGGSKRGLNSRDSYLLGDCSTTWATSPVREAAIFKQRKSTSFTWWVNRAQVHQRDRQKKQHSFTVLTPRSKRSLDRGRQVTPNAAVKYAS
jgi:hypothetical protein